MAHVLNTFFFLLRQIPAEGNFEEKFERKNHFFQKKTGQGKFERKFERKLERKFERKIRFFQKKPGQGKFELSLQILRFQSALKE